MLRKMVFILLISNILLYGLMAYADLSLMSLFPAQDYKKIPLERIKSSFVNHHARNGMLPGKGI